MYYFVFLTMLSIVIATKNRESILKETLKAFEDIPDLWELPYEIIIVNDGTPFTSQIPSLFPKLAIQIHKNKGSGAAAARNSGAANCKGEVILFCDDDIIPTTGHFQKHYKLHQQYADIIVTANRFYPDSLIAIANKKPFGRYKLAFEYNWLNNLQLTPFNHSEDLFLAETLASFSSSIKRAGFSSLGGFNESFPAAGCEDNEFYYRAKKNGYQLIFDQSNVCYHNELDNFKLENWLRRQSTGIKGAVISCEMYPEGKEHPTYYLNTPVNQSDSKVIRSIKRKRTILASSPLRQIILKTIPVLEFLRFPDKVLFKFYNAAWLGSTKKSFMEEFRHQSSKNPSSGSPIA